MRFKIAPQLKVQSMPITDLAIDANALKTKTCYLYMDIQVARAAEGQIAQWVQLQTGCDHCLPYKTRYVYTKVHVPLFNLLSAVLLNMWHFFAVYASFN